MNAGGACPCGSGRSYPACCEPLHHGAPAPTAEALMRSRYSAFVLRDEAYLLDTQRADQRPASIAFEPNLKWLGLKVVAAHEAEDHAEVEFIARYRVGGGSAVRHHERSRFVREGDRWFYVEGAAR